MSSGGSDLFEVYADTAGNAWGWTCPDGQQSVRIVAIAKNGKWHEQQVDPERIAALIGSAVRSGKAKRKQRMFLSVTTEGTARFASVHPDLAMEAHRATVFAPVPVGIDVASLAAQWAEELHASARLMALRPWAERVAHAGTYIAAFDNHPAASLLVGQWARTTGVVLMGTRGNPPDAPPAVDPLGWKQYLEGWFPTGEIEHSLRSWAWDAQHALNPSDPTKHALDLAPEQEPTNLFAMGQQIF